MSSTPDLERSSDAAHGLRSKLWPVTPMWPRLSFEVALLCGSAVAGIWLLGVPKYVAWHPTVLAWVLALPMLTGLVHGLPAAIVLTALVATGLHMEAPERWESLTDAFIASGVVALLAGHLSDMRRSALQVAHEQIARKSQQLERQYRQHQVLRTSHALLTERTSAQEWCVAASVDAAQRLMREGPVARSAEALLALLESQAMVRVAAVYLEESASKLAAGPTASLGLQGPAFSRLPAIRSAYQLGELVVPRADSQGHEGDALDVVLAVPLVSSAGRVFGVLAVYELPFVATHDAHFRLIATLASSVADTLMEQANAAESVVPGVQPVRAAQASPVPVSHATLAGGLSMMESAPAPVQNATLPGLAMPSQTSPASRSVVIAQAGGEPQTVVARPVITVRPRPMPRPAAPSISHTLEGRLPLPGAFQMPAETMPVAGLFNEPPTPPARFDGPVVAPLPTAPVACRDEQGSAPRPIPGSRRRGDEVSPGLRPVTCARTLQHASGA